MPNGGEHHERLGACPRCGSVFIRIRRRRHRNLLWRCQSCNRAFSSPRVADYVLPAGADSRDYVFAGSIPRMERRARRRAGGKRRRRTASFSLSSVVLGIILAVILLGAVGVFLFMDLLTGDEGGQPQVVEPIAVPEVVSVLPTASPLPVPTHTSTLAPVGTAVPTTTLIPVAATVASSTPTSPTPVPTSPAQVPTREAEPTPRATRMTARSITPSPLPTLTASLTQTPFPYRTPSLSVHPDPSQRHIEAKLYMLELINGEREAAGVQPVNLGTNGAAQLHAEAAMEHCFGGHWGADGLKPYMRYSLAGGYQSNAENSRGVDFCIQESDRFSRLGSVMDEVRQAVEGWMDSPGHRGNILGKWHRKVNIGIAWDSYSMWAYQYFEGDYVRYDQLPTIADGYIAMSGQFINGSGLSGPNDLLVVLDYDPPPGPLTRGQLARTTCYNNGMTVASLRQPLTGGYSWPEGSYETEHRPGCPDPYDVPAEAPAPELFRGENEIERETKTLSESIQSRVINVPWIKANEWSVTATGFQVEADVTAVLDEHGPRVYTVVLWAMLGEEQPVVSQYSIFHEVDPTDTYFQGR